jgi:glycosyltransferase involved in cell wall biosynthesis
MDIISLLTLLLFGFSFVLQCYFWLFIFSKAGNTPDSSGGSTTTHKISVVVCALNELNNLQKLIPLLLKQEYEDYEIIIVNDRSTDNTSSYLNSITDKRFSFIELKATPKGYDHKKFALQQGIKKAKYEYVLLTDADCIPKSSNWINEMKKPLNTQKNIVLGLSFYEKRPTFINHFIQFETFYTALQYLGFANSGNPYMGVGRNLLYNKELFLNNTKYYKFKNHLGGDDDLTLQQLIHPENFTTNTHPTSQTISTPKTTIKEWFNQKKRHLNAGTSYPTSIKCRLTILQASHFMFFLTLLVSLFYVDILAITLVGYLLRTLILFSIFDTMSKKFGNRLTKKEILFGDFVYVIYFFVTGIFTLYTKRLKWE